MGNDSLKNRRIIFFDGVCHLCNAFVDSIIKQDKAHVFLFAPLQGETAQALLSDQDRNSLDSVIYFEAGQLHYKSAAVLRILNQLGGLYKLTQVGRWVPGFLRDKVYNLVAKHRYAWFGQREFCRLPTAEERNYLLP